MQSRYFLCF